MPDHPINGLIEMLANSAKVELTPEQVRRLRPLPPGPININAIDPECPYGVEPVINEDRAEAKRNNELIEVNTVRGDADWSER